MKLEVGESLLRSWLRHVKQCQFAELNWKPSPLWNVMLEATEINSTIFAEATKTFGAGLFKKSSLSQLLRQGEIDALGMYSNNNSTQFYACDIAFHSQGLLYGSKSETILRVTKKLIRSALLLNSFLGTKDAWVVFASPKVSPEIEREICQNASYLKELCVNSNLNYSFEIFCNSTFESQILEAVFTVSDSVEDTSELFLRSHQLIKLFRHGGNQQKGENGEHEKVRKNGRLTNDMPVLLDVRGVSVQSTRSGNKSQSYLLNTISKILPVLTSREVAALHDKEFCKDALGLHYPLLITDATQIFNSGHRRYYSTLINKKYYVCNDWYQNNYRKWTVYLLSLASGQNMNTAP